MIPESKYLFFFNMTAFRGYNQIASFSKFSNTIYKVFLLIFLISLSIFVFKSSSVAIHASAVGSAFKELCEKEAMSHSQCCKKARLQIFSLQDNPTAFTKFILIILKKF